MSDRQLAYLAAAVALLALLVILLTARAAAARRDRILEQRTQHAARTKGDPPGLDLFAEDHGDEELLALNASLAVHPQCRRWHKAGFRSRVHRACLDQLRREERR